MRPELIKVTSQGGTIHSYDLPGGKTMFTRFLSCYLGNCKFCSDMDEATAHIMLLEGLNT